QEVNLVPGMSIAENICVGRYPRKGPFIDRKRMRERAQAAVRRLGLDVDVDELLGGVSVAIQQMVAIARALDVDCKVL
ncbi:sugar ABC transporter ATP-binding protein, partial [Vibrio parahaemolyticus]